MYTMPTKLITEAQSNTGRQSVGSSGSGDSSEVRARWSASPSTAVAIRQVACQPCAEN
jgi:hypothetical protein